MRISTKAFVSFAFAAALITAQSNDAFAAAKRGKDRQKEITRIKKEAQRLQEKVGGFKSEVQPRYDASVASSRRLRGVF